MPRQLTANAIAQLAIQYGNEPITIIEAFWQGAGQPSIQYADKANNSIPGRILEINGLDDVVKIDSQSSSASITITLDDTPGDLLAIMQTVDIMKKTVYIYQYFTGMSLADAFIVFVGQINSPITWSESERKLTFTVLSVIESVDAGFAPEEGQFPQILPQFIGKPWPLVFGDCLHVPAVKISEQVRGVTQTLIGVPDYTLPLKYQALVDRLGIISDGLIYYQNAITYLGGIARDPDTIEQAFIAAILEEDPMKQYQEDVTKTIADNDKLIEKLENMLGNNENLQRTLEQTVLNSTSPNIQSQLGIVQQIIRDRQDVVNYIAKLKAYLAPLKSAMDNVKITLSQLHGTKKLLEIEGERAEYGYKNTNAINKKYVKLYIEGIKTTHQLYKILTIINQQDTVNLDQVLVVNGDKFPQNIETLVTIKDMAFSGTFNGKIFNVDSIEPRYSNVQIADRQSDQIDAFWITDPTINLKGQYCVTTLTPGPGDIETILGNYGYDVPQTVQRVFKVIDQIGTMCVMELKELKPSIDLKHKTPTFPVLKDLATTTWELLAGAQEYTKNERQRILENGLPKYAKTEIDRLRSLIERLYNYLYDNIAANASQQDFWDVQEQIFKNIHEYNDRFINEKFLVEAVEKAFLKISKEEYHFLLKMENLKMRLSDQSQQYNTTDQLSDDNDLGYPNFINSGNTEGLDITSIPQFNVYYLTADQITEIDATSAVMLPAWFQFSPEGQELAINDTIIKTPEGLKIIANLLPDSTLWLAEPGSEVKLISDQTEKYICSILSSTVVGVYGHKGVKGVKTLVPVPKQYYTINQSDNSYLPLVCTTITLFKSLKDYPDEDWEDGLYVSMASSVGPNTVDIIVWLAETYTNVVIDSVSTNFVKSQIANFPSHFAIFEKKNAVSLIEEIAWQARCQASIVNGYLTMTYLATTPTPVDTITDDDIIFGSLQLDYTSTDSIITKFVAKWRQDYSNNYKDTIIVQYNIIVYGLIRKDFDFFIYNIDSLVYHSVTYWSIIHANTWKKIKFKTPLTKMALQTNDWITINTNKTIFSTGACLARIDKATFDSANNIMEFECWLPIRSGEMTQYDFAFPAGLAITVLYPPIVEQNAGFAGSPQNSIPKNLAYKIDPNQNIVDQLNLRPKDYGDAFPSDENYTFPTSPLSGLSIEDYTVVRPQIYRMPNVLDNSDNLGFPDYSTPLFRPDNDTQLLGGTGQLVDTPLPQTFVGRVVATINPNVGLYVVTDSAQNQYTVRQNIITDRPLAQNSSVACVLNAATNEYETIERNHREQQRQLKTFVVLEEQADYLLCVPFEYQTSTTQLHDPNLATEQQSTNSTNNINATNLQDQYIAPYIAGYNAGVAAALAGPPNIEISTDAITEFVSQYTTAEDSAVATSGYIAGYLGAAINVPNSLINNLIVTVAKPRLLQQTPFNNQTITFDDDLAVSYTYTEIGARTATSSGLVNENHVIIPPYFVADIIVARFGNTGYLDTNNNPVIWTDINEGGRAWAVDNS